MSAEEKQALTGLCKIEIKRWKAASESNPNMRYMVELMEIALASLEAEPEYSTSDAEDVHLDVSKAAFDRCHPDYRWVSYTAPPVPEDWKQRAEAAEVRASNLNDGWLKAIEERDEARTKLAELEKQDPVGHFMLVRDDDDSWWCESSEQNDKAIPLFSRPAPTVSLVDLVPDDLNGKSLSYIADKFNTTIPEAQFILAGFNACLAAIPRNIEEAK